MYTMRIKSMACALGILFSLTCEARIVRVTRVIDGDTVVLNDGHHVRLIGIDSPESFLNRKAEKDSARTGVPVAKINEMGAQSKKFMKKIAEGKRFKFVEGREKHDKYHRDLAYLYSHGTSINSLMIENGYACAYVKFPFEKKKQFVAAQAKAEARHVGLWRDGLNCN